MPSNRVSSITSSRVLAAVVVCAAWANGVAGDIASAAFEAFPVVQNWVARGVAPMQTPSITVPGVSAAHVTLRVGGVTIGQGTAVVAADTGETVEVDLMPLIAAALEAALVESRAQSIPSDAVRLDLQVASTPIRLRTEQLRDLPGLITPHAHALAMRHNGRWAWFFPGNAVASNTDLAATILRLAGQLEIPFNARESIGTADGPELFRADVVHLTTTAAGDPINLYRGRELLPSSPLFDQDLALLGEQLADNVVSRQRDDGRFPGAYEPTADRFDPSTADASATALAAYALARTSKLGGVAGDQRIAAAKRAADALAQLIDRPDPAGPQRIGVHTEATALTLIALNETSPGHAAERGTLAARLRSMLGKDGRFRVSMVVDAPPCSVETQALGAAALVSAFDRERDPATLAAAQAAIAATWETAGQGDEHRLMPWIVIAESDLIRLGRPTPTGSQIGELGSRFWAKQVNPLDESSREAPPDTIGGFIVEERLFREPTSESAPILAGLSRVLRENSFVGASEQRQWIVNCGLGARFIHQLTLQPSGAYYCRNPGAAVGGVQAALWDNRQPLQATAHSLIALTELRLSLRELTER